MKTEPGWKRDLAAYLGGSLTGDMGLRSYLGACVDRGGPASSSSSPHPPSTSALAAARASSRVRRALDRLTLEHAAVLVAYYEPRGPGAPAGLSQLGELAPVAVVLEELARCAELAAQRHPARPPHGARIRSLLAVSGPRKKRARREVRAILLRAGGALASAHCAYEEVHKQLAGEARLERDARLRATLGL